jgi:trehalose 6-phosphate phosphatase
MTVLAREMSKTQTSEAVSSRSDLTTRDAFCLVAAKPDRWAAFLDIDGTLLDLAPTPDTIVVPDTLAAELQALSDMLGGALALVTGRALAYADSLFRPHVFPIAGLHGAELRGPDGSTSFAESDPQFRALKAGLVDKTASMTGVLIEDKGAAVAAHYRLAPHYEEQLRAIMIDFSKAAGSGWALQLGKMVFEVRPARASKGDAVEQFMQMPPFVDRLPLSIGDDLTDESMFAVTNIRGGHSIRVGRPEASSCARCTAENPSQVRALIAGLSGVSSL